MRIPRRIHHKDKWGRNMFKTHIPFGELKELIRKSRSFEPEVIVIDKAKVEHSPIRLVEDKNHILRSFSYGAVSMHYEIYLLGNKPEMRFTGIFENGKRHLRGRRFPENQTLQGFVETDQTLAKAILQVSKRDNMQVSTDANMYWLNGVLDKLKTNP